MRLVVVFVFCIAATACTSLKTPPPADISMGAPSYNAN